MDTPISISPSDITEHMHNLRQYLPQWNLYSQSREDERQEFDFVLREMIQKKSWQHLSSEVITVN